MARVAGRSWASSPGVRRSMQSNRSRDTAPELALRSALHRRGLRFRKHVRPIPGLRCTVDVLFPTERLAVFVDGCYWHSCPEHGSYPITNGDWWRAKLAATRARDEHNTQTLANAEWTVLRVWEHEDADVAAGRVSDLLATLRAGPRS
jgi:DNA mismatch endonuclease (patch repair protein)